MRVWLNRWTDESNRIDRGYRERSRNHVTIKSFKYRLYPTRKQKDTLKWTLDRNRELYNAALQQRRDTWNNIKRHSNFYEKELRKQVIQEHGITCYDQINELPEIKEVREEYKQIH